MRRIKQIVSVVLLCVLVLALATGCPNSNNSSSSNSNSSYNASSSDTTIVYVTRTGEKYHRDGCRYLSKSKIEKTLSEAKAEGYTPCSVCNPPQ